MGNYLGNSILNFVKLLKGEIEYMSENKAELGMSLNTAIDFIMNSILVEASNLIFYLISKPGAGKTEMILGYINRYCKTTGKKIGLIHRNMGLMLTEQFSGIPEIKNTKRGYETVWSIPELVADAMNMEESGYDMIVIFFDDWHLAIKDVKAIGYELFTDYRVKGHKLPDNCRFVMAGNDSAASGSRGELSGITSRVNKLKVFADPEYWINNYALPNALSDEVTSFITLRENVDIFHGEEDPVDSWPNPRKWKMLSVLIKLMRKYELPFSLTGEMALYSSVVGENAARRFNTHVKIFKEFNVEKVLTTGEYEIPSDDSKKFIFIYAVTSGFYNGFYSNKKERAKMSNVWVEILRKISETNEELFIACFRQLMTKDTKGELIGYMASKGLLSTEMMDSLKKTSTKLL